LVKALGFADAKKEWTYAIHRKALQIAVAMAMQICHRKIALN